MTEIEPGGSTPRTVGDRRRDAVIQAAYALFMEKGYESVSIDEIIGVAGGSKATLYKYFGSKEGVLRAVVSALADEMIRRIDVEFRVARTPRQSLLEIGGMLVDLALSESAINQARHAIAHARSFPDIARLWFEAGPRRTMEGIARFLVLEDAKGRLRIDDPLQAAWFFAGLIIFRDNMTLLIGLPPTARDELDATVARAVDLFLAAYGA